MNLQILEEFLLWSLILNLCCALIANLIIMFGKKKVYRIHSKLFGVSEETIAKTVYKSLVTYKTLVVFFNVIPYAVLLIIK